MSGFEVTELVVDIALFTLKYFKLKWNENRGYYFSQVYLKY
jgi:hypothetical protein